MLFYNSVYIKLLKHITSNIYSGAESAHSLLDTFSVLNVIDSVTIFFDFSYCVYLKFPYRGTEQEERLLIEVPNVLSLFFHSVNIYFVLEEEYFSIPERESRKNTQVCFILFGVLFAGYLMLMLID